MSAISSPSEEAVAAAYQAVGALIYHFGLQENADCIRLQDMLAYGKTMDGVELLPWPRDPLPSEHDAIRSDRDAAVAEAAKLRARVAELEGAQDADHSAYVDRVGWGEDEDGQPRFEALISYPDGPPPWLTFGIVWDRKPVGIVLLGEAKTRGGDAR